jgi:hypothetical protein
LVAPKVTEDKNFVVVAVVAVVVVVVVPRACPSGGSMSSTGRPVIKSARRIYGRAGDAQVGGGEGAADDGPLAEVHHRGMLIEAIAGCAKRLVLQSARDLELGVNLHDT